MNKAELVEEVAGKVGLTKKETNNVVDAVTSAITDSLERNERVTLVGLGTFEVRRRRARTGVNPQTRETIQIPAKKVPKFVPGKGLRDKVKQRKIGTQLKENNKVAKGTIARLIKDRGYGFIATEDGKDVFFHQTALQGLSFDSLKKGQPVEFETEEGPKGPRAVNIKSSEKTEG